LSEEHLGPRTPNYMYLFPQYTIVLWIFFMLFLWNRFSDRYMKHVKVILLCVFSTSLCLCLAFGLICSNVIPFNKSKRPSELHNTIQMSPSPSVP